MADSLELALQGAVADAWDRVIEPGDADERLVTQSVEPSAEAAQTPLPPALHPELIAALRSVGIDTLYSHQAEALAATMEGNTVITSGTASGKSLSFNLAALDALAKDDRARALYLYPTKSLAQDQARKLSELELSFLHHAIYDGDTPKDDRPQIRRRANLVLTNPDMLHVGILPHSGGWADFLANLKWVVLDEAHTYRGVFGSHVANVLRRLRRAARSYGAEPRFVCASATIANPLELAESLVGAAASASSTPTALPRAGRRIGIWNPPLIDEESGTRRSTLSEAAELLADLVAEGVRTICFLRSRRGIELIQRFARMRLEEKGLAGLAARIAPYRAGYTPQQRREIEARLAAGDLLAVVATDALELGNRHRRARRRDLRHLPGHGREPAPDVGTGGAPAAGDRPVRGRPRRARPVLLPPPGGVPRAAGRGGDPRSRERADPPPAPARRRLRGAARQPGRGRDAR